MGLVPPDPLDPRNATDVESYCFALMLAGTPTDQARELLKRAVSLQNAAQDAAVARMREAEKAQEREETRRDSAMLAASRLLRELHLVEEEPEPPPQFTTYFEQTLHEDPMFTPQRG